MLRAESAVASRDIIAKRITPSRAMLASTLGRLGQAEEARRVWAQLKEIKPDYSFAVHRSRLPFGSAADTFAEGLDKAGPPV